MRLAFLRKSGKDPIDIITEPSCYALVYSHLSSFSLLPGEINWPPSKEKGAWIKMRMASNLDLMSQLYTAAHTANPQMPLWVSNWTVGDNFTRWNPNDMEQQAAVWPLDSADAPLPQPLKQGAFLSFEIEDKLRENPSRLADDLARARQYFGDGAPPAGVILDFVEHTAHPEALTDLALFAPYLDMPHTAAGN